MSNPRILVVGAGVAGLTLAAALRPHDLDVTVVERAPALRRGGQTVDLRGPARTVVQRLGLWDAVRELRVPQRGYAIVDAADRPLVQHPVELFGGHGIVSDTEVLRGDLLTLLASAAGPVRHGVGPTRVEDGHVAFSDGTSGDFDLVVGADGLASAVRRLAFGPDERFRTPLGVGLAWFTAHGSYDLDGWYRAHHAPNLRLAVRPSRHSGEVRAELAFRRARWSAPREGREAVLRDLEHEFGGCGWYGPRLLAAARTADDLAAVELARVHVPRWSVRRGRGHVVLLGDAAWCPSPLAGTGTALAIVGAHVLAAGLLAHDDTGRALASYQDGLSDWVARRGQLPPGGARGFVPGSRLALTLGRASMRAMTHRPLRGVAARVFSEPDELDLPAIGVRSA